MADNLIPAYLAVVPMLTSGEARGLRKRHGLSQTTVAKHCGLSRQTIHSWEQGFTRPRATSAGFRCYIKLLGDLAALDLQNEDA